nr:integrase, catalytic region, zinc finger, CCHC-type, peptidase aspartic, catalytic [Tanacetum cinerariifolium]
MTEFPQMDSALAVLMFTQGADLIACLNKALALLTAVASSRGNNARGQERVVKCYNCQGKGHMSRKCTQPKRPRNAAWFKEKPIQSFSNTVAFQIEDLDAYDSDRDDVSNAKAVLMANLSNYGSDVILESKLRLLRNFLRENNKEEKIKHDMDEIETINIELEHSVATLLSENECLHKEIKHLKNIYKDQVDSIKKTRALSKEHWMFKLDLDPLAPRSQPTDTKKNDRISQAPRSNMKNKVEVQCRRVNLSSNKKNLVKDHICDTNVKYTMLNANSELIHVKCNQCMFDANHDVCFLDFVNDVKIFIWYMDSGWSKHMTRNHSQLMNFVRKFLGTVRFKNDQITKIMRYGDYHLGNIIVSRVYYVEGLRHNLFSVGKFCDVDLEVAFWKNTCFIRNLEGVDLLSGSRDTNLYTISLDDMLKTSPVCILSKASKTKSWLWHCWLSHLNFNTLNKLAKDGLARGIPKLKFKKDHMCSACALGKSKKSSHKPKAEDTNQEKLYLLHMDLYGPMCVETWYVMDTIKRDKIQAKPDKTKHKTESVEKSTVKVSVVVAPRAVEIAATPSSTTIDQDAPSSSTSSTNQQQQSSIISQESSSNVQSSHSPLELIGKWTKDHPLANVIGNPSRLVFVRKQLKTDVMGCYFDTFLTSVKPKNFKEAMLESSWIKAMQEEIHESERLQV